MCGPDFFCSEELNAKKGIHFMPISGGARRINSKVIFAADSYWCDSYDVNHSGKCRLLSLNNYTHWNITYLLSINYNYYLPSIPDSGCESTTYI